MAYFVRSLEAEPREVVGIAGFLAIGGPIGAFVSAVMSSVNQHGWILWRGK